MELTRGDIERSDFSTARRGYEPAAVDAHLREVAAAVEGLQDRVEELSARPQTLSQAANERLARILEAAETSAAEIRTEAAEEARSLLSDAERESQTITEDAEHRARERDTESETSTAERLSRVDHRTAELMLRADALDEEFDQLLERMRAAGVAAVDTLREDARALRGELDELPGESVPPVPGPLREEGAEELEPPGRVEPDHPTAVVEPSVEPEPPGDEGDELFEPEPEPLGDEVIPEPRDGEPLPEPPEEPPTAPEDESSSETWTDEDEPTEARPSDGPHDSDPDMEGARLIALNMALSGSSRAETADYLRDTFGLEDRALLDDVYERVQAP
jgi:DivIVA domain-containing protein